MNTEDKLKEAIDEFKKELLKVADAAIDVAYAEVLPHIERDTFINVQYRSQAVIENAVRGEFTRINENTIAVKDDNDIEVKIKISDSQWDSIRTSLIEAMPSCPKDLEIASLERQIEALEKLLNLNRI